MTKKRITITLSEDDYIRNLVYSDYKNWDKE